MIRGAWRASLVLWIYPLLGLVLHGAAGFAALAGALISGLGVTIILAFLGILLGVYDDVLMIALAAGVPVAVGMYGYLQGKTAGWIDLLFDGPGFRKLRRGNRPLEDRR